MQAYAHHMRLPGRTDYALRAALEAMGDSYDATDAAGEEGAALWGQVADAIETATGETLDH